MLLQKIQYLTDFVQCLFHLFSAFICAHNIGILVNSFFGVKIFNPSPFYTSSSSLWLSSGGMDGTFLLLSSGNTKQSS